MGRTRIRDEERRRICGWRLYTDAELAEIDEAIKHLGLTKRERTEWVSAVSLAAARDVNARERAKGKK